MATKGSVETSETISPNRQAKELSRGLFGTMLLLTVLSSFNAGMFTTLGLRHVSASHDSLQMMFLVTGCISFLAAVIFGVVIFKRAATA